jgi:hypothetical protein
LSRKSVEQLEEIREVETTHGMMTRVQRLVVYQLKRSNSRSASAITIVGKGRERSVVTGRRRREVRARPPNSALLGGPSTSPLDDIRRPRREVSCPLFNSRVLTDHVAKLVHAFRGAWSSRPTLCLTTRPDTPLIALSDLRRLSQHLCTATGARFYKSRRRGSIWRVIDEKWITGSTPRMHGSPICWQF